MDDNPETRLQYFAALAEDEFVRIENLMAPFLEEKTEEQKEIAGQLMSILGEFGARISVIERAAQQLLLRDGALRGEPLLYGALEIYAKDLDPADFHELEKDGRGVFVRWSRHSAASFVLPVYRANSCIVRIYFSSIIREGYAKSLKILGDNKELKHTVKRSRDGLYLKCRLPVARDLAPTVITISLPAVHSASELGNPDDKRKLGIAISRVSINKPYESFLDRILLR